MSAADKRAEMLFSIVDKQGYIIVILYLMTVHCCNTIKKAPRFRDALSSTKNQNLLMRKN